MPILRLWHQRVVVNVVTVVGFLWKNKYLIISGSHICSLHESVCAKNVAVSVHLIVVAATAAAFNFSRSLFIF